METESLNVEEFRPQLEANAEKLLILLQECGKAVKGGEIDALKASLDKLKLEIARLEADLNIQPQTIESLFGQVRDYWHNVTERLQVKKDQHMGPLLGLSSGFGHLDNLLDGLRPGLHILLGAPSIGKSTFLNQIAFNVAREAHSFFVPFEDTPIDLVCQHISRESEISLRKVRRGQFTREEDNNVSTAIEKLARVKTRLSYLPGTRRLTCDILRGLVRERVKDGDFLLVVDHLQKFAAMGQPHDFRMAVLALTQELRDMANDLQIPILATSQLGRGWYEKTVDEVTLDSAKESGEVEYSADTLLVLAKEKDAPSIGKIPMQLKVLKQRHGDRGKALRMVFEPAFARFGEVEER